MVDINRISYTVISYVTEENDRVVKALKNCLPPNLREKSIDRQGTQSQFGDPLIIYSFESETSREIKEILSYYGDRLTESNLEYLSRHFEDKLDLNTRSLYLRFNKFKAYEDELEITEGSDVIRVEISYSAYTQKQNSLEVLRKKFANMSLIKISD